MFLRAGEFISNQEILNFRLATHEAPRVDFQPKNSPTCNEAAAILLDDNVRAERDTTLHQFTANYRYAPGVRSTALPLAVPT